MPDFFQGSREAKHVNIEEALDATFMEYLRELVDGGTLVSIGSTRDGGALSITITYDGRWRREYLHDPEDIHTFVKEAAMAVTESGGRPPAPTSRRTQSHAKRGG